MLARSITDVGIIDIHGDELPFRRRTDYLLCPECHNLYSVAAAREGLIEPNRLPTIDLFRGRIDLARGTDAAIDGVDLSNLED